MLEQCCMLKISFMFRIVSLIHPFTIEICMCKTTVKGEQDLYLGKELLNNPEKICANVSVKRVADANHFVNEVCMFHFMVDAFCLQWCDCVWLCLQCVIVCECVCVCVWLCNCVIVCVYIYVWLFVYSVQWGIRMIIKLRKRFTIDMGARFFSSFFSSTCL